MSWSISVWWSTLVSCEKSSLNITPKAATEVCWITEIVWQKFLCHRTPNRDGLTAECSLPEPQNGHEVTTGRSQVLSTGDIRHWDAAVNQVLRCFVLKAPVNHHCQLVLHSETLSQCSSSCRRRDKPWSNLRVPETRRDAAFSTRWSVSVIYWGDPASMMLH